MSKSQQKLTLSSATTYRSSVNDENQDWEHSSESTEEADYDQSTRRRTKNSMLHQEASDFFSYSIDWSRHASPTSHCWLPCSPKNSIISRSCACLSCQKPQSLSESSLAECPTCSLIIHTCHLSEQDETEVDDNHYTIPPCRASFMDDKMAEKIETYDQHHWSHVSVLSMPCTYCKRKTLKNSSVRTIDQHVTVPKPDEPSSGLICMWCSRNYHQICWNSAKFDKNNNGCDYGEFGNIVVRPQWLRRVTNTHSHFRAQMPGQSEANGVTLTPVIFFINKLSGGQKGQQIYRTLVRLLNPRQVFLLENDATITQALQIYSSLNNTRICICGGDGTVGWVLSHIADMFPLSTNPPAGIYPLGTGNDLSRVLGWGDQYSSTRLFQILTQIVPAHPMALDRWKIHIETLEPNASNVQSENIRQRCFSFMEHPRFIRNGDLPLYENHRTPINSFFFNYISFGLDAAVVLDFHARRTRDPSGFTSPLKNKLVFISESRKYFNDFAFGIAWNISSYLRLICDGEDFTDSIRSCHSIVLLNTRGFGSGTQPWGRTATTTTAIATATTINYFEAQDFGDGKIEVLGLNTRQMALIHVGFRGTRIAQCSRVRIELSHPMPVHMDGEPFHLAGSTAIDIKHAGQVMVLSND
ncbi:hypothetical protein I4U23_019886 [Adineta vaga]|nr:hypothetical protein I4U23_019886 [Adineta vaga]